MEVTRFFATEEASPTRYHDPITLTPLDLYLDNVSWGVGFVFGP